jgi:molybdate transport system substrate-binding protein
MRPVAILVLALHFLAAAPPQQPPAITVFAASDLALAFKQIVPLFETRTGSHVTLVLGSTGMLTQQIRNGAPADVFFAANQSFADSLTAESIARKETMTVYATGRIALVKLKSSPLPMNDLKDLASPQVKRVAIANPQHAPYGLAARQALERAGVWTTIQQRLVFGENVQQAVQFVRSGSAEAGVVARSVADTSDLSWTLIDAQLHEPLNQVAVILARTRQPALAQSFLEFVNGGQGRAVMRSFGFLLPGE